MNINIRLFKFALKAWQAFFLTVIMSIFGAIFIVLQARFLSVTIADVFLNGQSLEQIRILLVGLFSIMTLRSLMIYLADASAGIMAIRIKNWLRSLLTGKIIQLGPAYIMGENSGELSTVLIQGVESLDAYFSQYLPQLLLAALVPLVILFAVFPLDWITGFVLLITAPLIPLFMVLIGKAAEKITRRQWLLLSRLSAVFLDTIQGLSTLKIFNQSHHQGQKISLVSEQYHKTTMAVLKVAFLSALVLELVTTISTAIIAVQVGLRLLYGKMAFVDAFFILVIAPDFYLPLRMLGQRFHASINGITMAARIFNILDTLPDRHPHDNLNNVVVSEALNLWRSNPNFTISFHEVCYQYPGRASPALDNISIRIESGQKIALVGLSGSGKSTLTHLLLRFIEPQKGQITFNGIPIHTIMPYQWFAGIAWVPQTPFFFNDTLLANIRLANPDAKMEDIVEAVHLAHLDDFISTLPKGFDTVIGEQGSRLSGGQAQRLALARAFIKNAPLLILDEPTAHLDPQQQTLLDDVTKRIFQDRTVIVIAHRLSTIINADQVLVMDHGRIAEQGTHRSLVTQPGFYYRLIHSGRRMR